MDPLSIRVCFEESSTYWAHIYALKILWYFPCDNLAVKSSKHIWEIKLTCKSIIYISRPDQDQGWTSCQLWRSSCHSSRRATCPPSWPSSGRWWTTRRRTRSSAGPRMATPSSSGSIQRWLISWLSFHSGTTLSLRNKCCPITTSTPTWPPSLDNWTCTGFTRYEEKW